MKIAYLIAGAGGMYCGSCLRDNRLAGKLIERGCDLAVIPLYTPLRTDEEDHSNQPIQYGGINVYLQQKSALFRRAPRTLSRMLSSPTVLRWAGRRAARTSAASLGGLTVSVLSGEDGAQRTELDRLVQWLQHIKPALINLPNLMFAGIAGRLKRTTNARIVCNLSGEDLFLDSLDDPYRDRAYKLIRKAAAHIEAFIAPTRYFADRAVERFGIDKDRVHDVPLGIRLDDFEPADEEPPGTFVIGYLARIAPEKGLDRLCEAFTDLRKRGKNCKLRVAGYRGAGDKAYQDRIVSDLENEGVAGDVEIVGEVSRREKADFLRSVHMLSVPTSYPEAKGLFVLEALASGVPVVQPNHGSFPELVESTGGGVIYDRNRTGALAEAIASLMDDPGLRRRLAAAGREAVARLYSDEIMADRTLSVYDTVLNEHRPAGESAKV